MKLRHLKLWMDPVPRTGPEAMAVDEWLLMNFREPVLRVYRWRGEWGSLGYFDRLSEAQAALPDIPNWVRRWTGGGMVDHRHDWPYTLIIPGVERGERKLGGAESYRQIHSALRTALAAEDSDIRLTGGEQMTGAKTCFDNPVSHDLVDAGGRKVAGAGQRRSSVGLMHQGSVALPPDGEVASRERAGRLATALAPDSWQEIANSDVPADWLRNTVGARYGNPGWTSRRP